MASSSSWVRPPQPALRYAAELPSGRPRCHRGGEPLRRSVCLPAFG
jgi:hypothetical protein